VGRGEADCLQVVREGLGRWGRGVLAVWRRAAVRVLSCPVERATYGPCGSAGIECGRPVECSTDALWVPGAAGVSRLDSDGERRVAGVAVRGLLAVAVVALVDLAQFGDGGADPRGDLV